MIEDEVVKDMNELLIVRSGPKGLTLMVNEELKSIWEESTDHKPIAVGELIAIDSKIANIKKSIEEDLADTAWVNELSAELASEKQEIRATLIQLIPPLSGSAILWSRK